MASNPFQSSNPSISNNPRVRVPQRETFESLINFARESNPDTREVGIVLPVGCGKSGCITIAPFAFRAHRALVIAPGVAIAQQLYADFDPANSSMFYAKCHILEAPPYPEPVEIRGDSVNIDDLREAHVVVTNIHQLQGAQNRWLQSLPNDFFDLILFDEGHHNIAASWETLRSHFPAAKIVNFSATPLRSDGQLMAGRILYSFPISRAIQEGYVKQLKAVVLNPRTLRYVRREDGNEIEVSLEEVRRLGEQDADFRRSIVTSTETLNTIVDASIRELERLRSESGERNLKIIASALNLEHCRQIVQAYEARRCRADYVHSRVDAPSNQAVMRRLENHELDVIVQVRKLGEGFDHPYLAVAAVFSIFSNLSPFVQFVGRIMRVIKQNAPGDVLNRGSVIFHAGANIARRWEDFQQYSEADQEYFDQLLPLETLDFSSANELSVEPRIIELDPDVCEVRYQSGVQLQEIPLLHDEAAMAAIRLLSERGYSADEVTQAMEDLRPVPVTRVRERQAMRVSLDTRIRNEVGRILGERAINHQGRELDTKRLGKTNFVVVKSAIDRAVAAYVDRPTGARSEYNRTELDSIEANFDRLVAQAVEEVFHASN